MNSHVTEKFRKAFAELPADVQKQARQAYRLFMENPRHPSLRFKSIHPTRPIYSVRIGLGYRAVGIREEDDIIGIGSDRTQITINWFGSSEDNPCGRFNFYGLKQNCRARHARGVDCVGRVI